MNCFMLFLSIKSHFLPILLLRQIRSRYMVGISWIISAWFRRLITDSETFSKDHPGCFVGIILRSVSIQVLPVCWLCCVSVSWSGSENKLQKLLAEGRAVTCCLPAGSVSLLQEVFVPLQSSWHLDRMILTPCCMVASPLPPNSLVFSTYSL